MLVIGCLLFLITGYLRTEKENPNKIVIVEVSHGIDMEYKSQKFDTYKSNHRLLRRLDFSKVTAIIFHNQKYIYRKGKLVNTTVIIYKKEFLKV